MNKQIARMLACACVVVLLVLCLPVVPTEVSAAEPSYVDLSISAIKWDNDFADQVTPGTKLLFTVSVTNVGTQAYPAKPLKVTVSVDAKPIQVLEYTGGIQPKQTVTLSSPADQPWVATLGDHTISAEVAADASVTDASTRNNGKALNLYVAKKENFLKAPAAALEKGHSRLTFSDHFNDYHTIDTTASGRHGYKWYITRPWGEANLDSGDYSVKNGVLYLTTDDTRWNYSMCTIDADHVGVGFSYNTGYMEIRVRMKETAEGGTVTKIRVPAVWAFSDETIWEVRPKGIPSVELDWFEYWGNKYGEDLRFDTTLHETRFNANGNQTSKVSSGKRHFLPMGDYEWHTYAMSWSEGCLKTYFDGKRIGILWYYEDKYPHPLPSGSPNVEAGTADPIIGTWHALDSQFMPIILGGASDFPMEVDWIHVWESDGSVKAQPEPTGDARYFLDDYLTNEDGYITKSLTVDNFTNVIQAISEYERLTKAEQQSVDKHIGASYRDWYDLSIKSRDGAVYIIDTYTCNNDAVWYKSVDASNAWWISEAADEWNALPELGKTIANERTLKNCGMTFDTMLKQALRLTNRTTKATTTTGMTAKPTTQVTNKPKPTGSTTTEIVETTTTTESETTTTVPNTTTSEVQTDTPPRVNVWAIIGAIGGAIVVGGGIVLCIILIKRKR